MLDNNAVLTRGKIKNMLYKKVDLTREKFREKKTF